MYAYKGYQWLLIFFLYSFLGWIFESVYVSVKERRLVNRGFLRIPMLPLYGTGAVMMLVISLPFQDHLFLVYLSGVIGATILEYITGWGMERLFKMRYWDYSDQRFNVNGYICLSSSLVWGFLTILLTEVIHKPINRLILTMDYRVEIGITAVIACIFAADTVESVRTALNLRMVLEKMTSMRTDLEELQVQLALLKGQLKEQTSERVQMAQEETAIRIAEIKAAAAARMDGMKGIAPFKAVEATTAMINELKEETAARLSQLKSGTTERLSGLRDSTTERLSGLRDSTTERLGGLRDSTAEKLGEFVDSTAEKEQAILEKLEVLGRKASDLGRRRQELGQGISAIKRFYLRGMIRGNPTAVSPQFKEALEDLQTEIKNRNKRIHRKKG